MDQEVRHVFKFVSLSFLSCSRSFSDICLCFIAFDTICRGVLSMYISHHDITAQTMIGLSLFDVSQLFDIHLSVEIPVPESPIMTQFVDAPTKPLAIFLHKGVLFCDCILFVCISP